MANWLIQNGDCLEVLKMCPAEFFDAMVTDPPAGISFMGRDWDNFAKSREGVSGMVACLTEKQRRDRDNFIAFMTCVMKEAMRCLKPGAHCLVWALPRTSHWTGMAIEDSGMEVREIVHAIHGQGFPKNLDISKAIDKLAGAEREVVGKGHHGRSAGHGVSGDFGHTVDYFESKDGLPITAPATDDAKTWDGWGTATKPAVEHWILCRKPLAESSIARNVLTHGTGAINIDGCRVEPTGERLGGGGEKRASLAGKEGWGRPWMENPEQSEAHAKKVRENVEKASEAGRWPPNLLLTHSADCGDECVEGCPVAELDRQSGKLQGSYRAGGRNGTDQGEVFSFNRKNDRAGVGYSEPGGASRFFPTFRYQAKPSRSEKEQGLAELPERTFNRVNPGGLEHEERWAPVQVKNNHPTVKSIELMRWLCRLITPPGGMVLDPFAGSFTTGCAALLEGFRFFGIEQDPAYCEIGAARLTYWEPSE